MKIRYHYIRELVSERTLSLKKIIGAKNPANMLTKVVTIKNQLASEITNERRLVSYQREVIPSLIMKVTAVALLNGRWLRAEGSDVDLTKHNRGRTLLTQKLLGILLLSRAEED
ncbi:hypothetical protein Tco_0243380 [Tanacetum coccineum]